MWTVRSVVGLIALLSTLLLSSATPVRHAQGTLRSLDLPVDGSPVATPSPAAAAQAVPRSAVASGVTGPALTAREAATVVATVPAPIGGVMDDLDVAIDVGDPIPLLVQIDVPDSETTAWHTLQMSQQAQYLYAVVAALHNAYPDVAPIYVEAWVHSRTDVQPSLVPSRFVDVCQSSSGRSFCAFYPDIRSRYDRGRYEYQPINLHAADRWLPLP
jgi:hypothetical protein